MWKAPFSRAGPQAEPLEACVHSFISLCSWLWVQRDHLFLGPHTVTAVALQPGTVKHNNPSSIVLLLSGVLSARQETNKWFWYQNGVIAMTNLSMWLSGLWKSLSGGMWKSLGLWTGKTIECYEASLLVILLRAWKVRILWETWTVEGWLRKFQTGARILLGIGTGCCSKWYYGKEIDYILSLF